MRFLCLWFLRPRWACQEWGLRNVSDTSWSKDTWGDMHKQTVPLFNRRFVRACSGERGGLILPKLLRPGALTSHEQRAALRSQAGVSERSSDISTC